MLKTRNITLFNYSAYIELIKQKTFWGVRCTLTLWDILISNSTWKFNLSQYPEYVHSRYLEFQSKKEPLSTQMLIKYMCTVNIIIEINVL